MIKLKKIILHLDPEIYQKIEDALIKNKAENFLYLLQSYRKTELKDEEIATHLGINSNSLYVLKSRLNDKIQENLSGNIFVNKEEVLKQLHLVPEMVFSRSREVAEAFLQKLEKDLLHFDMHNELLVIYSALKKLNSFSEKYFHYSQLYNRHAAFTLALEKCEEILGNFTRVLGQYNFSRSPAIMDTLQFLLKDISGHYQLNPSRQIEIIRNFIELQLFILTSCPADNFHTEKVLLHTEKLINELPESSAYKSWLTPLNFLFFEYYRKIGQLTAASSYFEKMCCTGHQVLLYTPICLTGKFLTSRLIFQQDQPAGESDDTTPLLYNNEDMHTTVLLGLYRSTLLYRSGKYKEAITELNTILNNSSFKDYFHINMEVRMGLAFFYLRINEYELADNLLKNITRKIKSEESENYPHILTLIKVLTADIKQNNGKVTQKQKDDFVLFLARNVNERESLAHLVPDLKKRYV